MNTSLKETEPLIVEVRRKQGTSEFQFDEGSAKRVQKEHPDYYVKVKIAVDYDVKSNITKILGDIGLFHLIFNSCY